MPKPIAANPFEFTPVEQRPPRARGPHFEVRFRRRRGWHAIRMGIFFLLLAGIFATSCLAAAAFDHHFKINGWRSTTPEKLAIVTQAFLWCWTYNVLVIPPLAYVQKYHEPNQRAPHVS